MSFLLDAVTAIIFIVIIFGAYKKGFVRSLIELLGTVVSIIIAFQLSFPFGNWIDGTFMQKFVNNSITRLVSNNGNNSNEVINQLLSAVPKAAETTLSSLNNGLGTLGSKALEAVISAVSVPLSSLISRSMAFFIIFALCMVLLGIIAHATDVIFKLPVIGSINSLAGAVIGFVEAVIVIFIISAVISFSVSFFSLQKNPVITSNTIESTHIFKYINNINPLSGMLLKN
ncbi:MAG TPA: CvpA family protein [Ruminiclostridium sp.]|nr:CvpA family protein [Ruminiclostridium sp.]